MLALTRFETLGQNMASVNANEWKPSKLLTVILALFLNAFAFLYVNKARWFWVYVIVTLIVCNSIYGAL